MSEPRIAALVCEGHTDVPILKTIVHSIWPSITDVFTLQPQLDELERAKGPAGWTQVQSWCEQNAAALEDVLNPALGDAIDLLIVAVDIDIAIDAGIADPPREVGGYEATRLRDTIEGWLRRGRRKKLPPAIVISTPVMAIEAWIIAALFPKERHPEQIRDGAQWLVDRKKLRPSPKNGKPWKELHRYRAFTQYVKNDLQHIRQSCTEAERTCKAIENRRDQLTE